MKKLMMVLLLCAGVQAASAQKQASPEKVKELMNLTGAANLGNQMMGQMIKEFKKMLPQVDTTFWSGFEKKADLNKVIGEMIPVYQKYFTEEDVDGMITFYKSPVGRKVVAQLPMVMQEAYAIGGEWGKKIGEEMIQELKAKGYQIE